MLPRTLLVLADDKLSLTDPRVLWPTFGLVIVLLVSAVVLSWFDRWRKRTDRALVSPADQLNAFRLSYERGELSQEEYKRIKARLAPRIKEQLSVPQTPTDEASVTKPPPASPPAPSHDGSSS
jgi:hypothetical protein